MSTSSLTIASYADGVKLSDHELKRLMSLPDWNKGYFETMRLSNGTLPLWSYHANRLKRGEQYTGIPLPSTAYITDVLNEAPAGEHRCRLTIISTGVTTSSAVLSLHPLPQSRGMYHLKSASIPHPFTDSHNPMVKLSQRDYYNTMYAQARAHGADDALLYSSQGFISETCIANILVLSQDGTLQTPAASLMPLMGNGLQYARDSMAPETEIQQVMLSYEDLISAKAVWVINALRGVVPVTQIDNHPITQDETQTHYLASLFPF